MRFPCFAVHTLRPPSEPTPWRKDRITNRGVASVRERIRKADRFTAIRTDGNEAERDTRHLRDRLNVAARRRRQIINGMGLRRQLVPAREPLKHWLRAAQI